MKSTMYQSTMQHSRWWPLALHKAGSKGFIHVTPHNVTAALAHGMAPTCTHAGMWTSPGLEAAVPGCSVVGWQSRAELWCDPVTAAWPPAAGSQDQHRLLWLQTLQLPGQRLPHCTRALPRHVALHRCLQAASTLWCLCMLLVGTQPAVLAGLTWSMNFWYSKQATAAGSSWMNSSTPEVADKQHLTKPPGAAVIGWKAACYAT